MNDPDERPDGDRPADDDAAEQMLAVSAELGDTEHETGWRSRSGTVRRRQRVVRGATPGETEVRERTRVRSVAEEGVGGERPTGPGPAGATPETDEPTKPVMLDAQGNPIDTPIATTTTTTAPAAPVVPDAGRFLADAVRSYLDGLDDLGVDHPVTADRLAQLRRTLERYEHG
ncbi:MAG TPA: hypothetical protein VK906_08165 [Egicoccus sp.]|nr:hypothetical protein [Egicoccus sp.]HSK23134.1 hypothetical protein [Egicoccus sp.]